MARTPLPQSVPAVNTALTEHQREATRVENLIGMVNAEAGVLATLIKAQPTTGQPLGPGRVRRYVEVQMHPDPQESELTRSVRAELCITTAGLETRSAAWERAANSHRQMLEGQTTQLSHMTTLDVSFDCDKALIRFAGEPRSAKKFLEHNSCILFCIK